MKKLDKKLQNELTALSKMKEEKIDTVDIPEINDFSDAQVGKFYRPLKKQVTLRVDADLLAWFKQSGKGYQTRINEALREYVKYHQKPATK